MFMTGVLCTVCGAQVYLTSCPGLIRVYEISICHVLHCPYILTPIGYTQS